MENHQVYAASIGFFDGVHRGHQFLIERLKLIADEKGQDSMVITFAQHPRQVLQSDWMPRLLSTPEEKVARLRQTGIDRLEVLHFDADMSKLTAREFMEQVLLKRLNVRTLLMGYDNRFGHKREEGFDDYVRYGQELGMEVMRAEALHNDALPLEGKVSSSLIRRLLENGDVEEAARCLGRPYVIAGRVVHGEQIGRGLGFPTANLLPGDKCKLIPGNGVYAVVVKIGDGERMYQGMTNIGTRPTFEGHRTTIETHLFDFDGDLYDREMTLWLMGRLRDEQHFPDTESLVSQMEDDSRRARLYLANIHY